MLQGNSNWRGSADWISSREQQSNQQNSTSDQQQQAQPPLASTFSGNMLRRRGGIESSDSEAEGSGSEKKRIGQFNGTNPIMEPNPPMATLRKPIMTPGEQQQQQQSQKKRRLSQVPQDPRLGPRSRPTTPFRDAQIAQPTSATPSTSTAFSGFAQYAKPVNNLFSQPKPVVEPLRRGLSPSNTQVKKRFSPSPYNEDASSERSSSGRMDEWANGGSSRASGSTFIASSSNRASGSTLGTTSSFGGGQQQQQQRGAEVIPPPHIQQLQHKQKEELQKKRRERSTTKERQPPPAASARKKSISEIAPITNCRPSSSSNGPSSSSRASGSTTNNVRVICPKEVYKAMQAKHDEMNKLVKLLEYENDMFKSICARNNLPHVDKDPVIEKIRAYRKKYN